MKKKSISKCGIAENFHTPTHPLTHTYTHIRPPACCRIGAL